MSEKAKKFVKKTFKFNTSSYPSGISRGTYIKLSASDGCCISLNTPVI